MADDRAPWTIRGVSRETRDLVLKAAASRGEPVGAWLHRAARAPSNPLSSLASEVAAMGSLLQAYVACAASAEVPADKGLVEEYGALLRDLIRQARKASRDPR